MILEIAAGVAAQASGIGGPLVAAAAVILVILTAAYLLVAGRQSDSLVEQLRSFVSERRVGAPPGDDDLAHKDYEADTLECFQRLHAPAVRRRTLLLHEKGLIGMREQRRLNSPQSLDDIDQLADRLVECDDPLDR